MRGPKNDDAQVTEDQLPAGARAPILLDVAADFMFDGPKLLQIVMVHPVETVAGR